MEQRIYDEKNRLWYERRGDYYLPCLAVPEQRSVGVWGERHRRYLREHKRGGYSGLLLSGKLDGYLAALNEQAEDMFLRLVKEMAEKEGITEALKAENQMLWVRRMNAVRETAVEIVNNDLIYA